VLWDIISGMVRQGHTPDSAIDQIYAIYGQQTCVTSIINAIKKSRKDGTLNPILRL
jgi:hypothetical protein